MTNLEKQYRNYLCSNDKIPIEKDIVYGSYLVGKCDDSNESEVIEFKRIADWKHAVGQVLSYSFFSNKKPVIHLLDDGKDEPERRIAILKICKHYNIKVKFISIDELSKVINNMDPMSKLNKKDQLKYLPMDIVPEFKKMTKETINYCMKEMSMSDYTLEDLRSVAKKEGIKGYSSMKKDDLIDAIEEHHKLKCSLKSKQLGISPSKKTKQIDTSSMARPDLVKMVESLGLKVPSKPYLRVDDLKDIIANPSEYDDIIENAKSR